jgi:hypothetical protein
MDEKRKEYVSIWCTPEVKREFELAKDNPTLQETIIRRYLKSETDFLEQEIKEIDDYTVKYKARLIGIREAFSKAQGSYLNEIEAINEVIQGAICKVDAITKPLNDSTKRVLQDVKTINETIASISSYKLESFISTIEKFNNLTKDEKELIKILMTKQ